MAYFESYTTTILILGVTGLMMLVQLLVADLAGLKSGHVPGHPVVANHEDLLFRASRALSNTNESIAIFILFALFGMFSGASPYWLGVASCVYAVGRLAHMLSYYANLKLSRSIAFGVGLMGLFAMFFVAVSPWV